MITAQALLMMTDEREGKRAAESATEAMRDKSGTYEVKRLITSLSSRMVYWDCGHSTGV
jgi:hypothetical protein